MGCASQVIKQGSVLAVGLLMSCARPSAPASAPAAQVTTVTTGGASSHKPVDADLLEAAEAALEAQDAPAAAALFGRFLARGTSERAQRRQAYLGLARAHELSVDCEAVLRTYSAYLAEFEPAEDRLDVLMRRGACEAELGRWQQSAQSFAEVGRNTDQLPSVRVEALARQGYALFELEQLEPATAALIEADEIFIAAQESKSERFSNLYFVGMARFYRAAVFHVRFRQVALELPRNAMQAGFDRKMQLLTEAQDAYNHTIKAKHMFWVSAAGYQLGHLFGEFYDDLMHAPVPKWLGPRDRKVYFAELRKQLRPVMAKAIWVLEKNLETAARLGYESSFTERTQAKLGHLQAVLASDSEPFGPLPRLTREEPSAVAPQTPTDPRSAVDRKLFVPLATPL